jgi:predicted HTH transcriptional regulator
MLKISTKEDLQRLVDEEIQESLTLDYKASPSLARDDKSRDELCKDVSAFANSAGGQIIYGIVEKDRKPVKVDDGGDLSREWIEQVIDSRVQPRLDGLVITPVPVGSGRHAYVLTIPQASSRAPHQAPDKKYYKRQNFSRWKTTKSATPSVAQQRQNFTLNCLSRQGKELMLSLGTKPILSPSRSS